MEGDFFSAEHLEKSWGAARIKASLSCARGTMTSIVGPSGSGKSTVLRLIAGLERSDSPRARIVLDGEDITARTPGRRGIGMVFQRPALFAHLRVDDNVAYGLRSAGMGRREARARATEFLARFNLAGFGARAPETLSGGEAQRVSLARTLIMRPKLLLLDEPLSALDAPLRKRLAAEIRALQRDLGFTAIMVTHDIGEAKAMSDDIILLKAGEISWRGSAAAFSEDKF